jgi:hypothetical protein
LHLSEFSNRDRTNKKVVVRHDVGLAAFGLVGQGTVAILVALLGRLTPVRHSSFYRGWRHHQSPIHDAKRLDSSGK